MRRAAARVHHSNVANVVLLNQDLGNPFYAMEFIAGESLRDWLRTRCPLDPLLAIGRLARLRARHESMANRIVEIEKSYASLGLVGKP